MKRSLSKVRIGVVGLGNIGRHHATYLAEGKVPDAELAAVCTGSTAKAAAFPKAKAFQEPLQLFRSRSVDAVIIATPHFQHTTFGIGAFESGLHLLMEKPISAHKADAERLIAVANAHPKLVFSGMFQFRVEPRYMEMRRIVLEGGLGKLLRISWIMTDWFRTEAYYASGSWRATWKGEGGGVLLNQCLHNLDILQWLTGMPHLVRGFCSLGKHHNVEVEDEATAWFEYANGAAGTLVTSTGETPGTNRLEIFGTKGGLLLENEKLIYTQNSQDSREFSRKAMLGFARPESTTTEIPIPAVPNAHERITSNFVRAILRGEPLIAPGAEGVNSVELANAILFSSLEGRTVNLPLDGAAYECKLQELIAQSKTGDRKVVQIAGEDVSKSFRR